jgi:peptidyl-tRNA hydrolase
MRENPILYVVLNKELNMSAGKAAAQAVHAAMMLGERGNHFTKYPKRTVIVLEAENSDQIKNLEEYLNLSGLFSDYYIDEGANEVGAYSVTALACEPIEAGDEARREIFAPLKLYSGNTTKDAYMALSNVLNNELGWFGVPRHVRRTVKWLRKNK